MIEDSLDLAQYRLQKAHNHLRSAEILLNAGMYNDSLGRSYYAMFNAAGQSAPLYGVKKRSLQEESGLSA